MENIAIIGKGNLGTHLFSALQNISVNATLIDSHTLKGLVDRFSVILIAVPDSSIFKVAGSIHAVLPGFEGVLAHTAGSVSLEILKQFKNSGVFYPLQTFNKHSHIDNFKEIPIFIEGNNEKSQSILKGLADKLSNSVFELSSEKRERLHLASVFACNFANAMYSIAANQLEKNKIPFEVLQSLIRQTANNALSSHPDISQTGPARRGDVQVMENHINYLSEEPLLADIYKLVSSYISQKHNNEQD